MRVLPLLLILLCSAYIHGASNQAIYTEALAPTWQDWSWATTRDPSAGAFIYSAPHSYSWKPNNWDGLSFHCQGCINPTIYSKLEFYINGGSASGEQILLSLVRYDGHSTTTPQPAKDITTYIGSAITSSTWKKVTVLLSDFPSGNYDGIILQANSASSQPTVYIDAMQLVAASPCTNQIKIAGVCSWAAGVNLPWNDYGRDFGTNQWGHNGIAVTSSAISTDYTNIHSYHARVVRWWLLSDLRAGVTFDASGTPTGLDAFVFSDMETMLTLSAQKGIYVVISLLDFGMANKAKTTNGVQTGGRASVINNPTRRAALLSRVIAPILTRFANYPNILAWEIMNEPEWVVSDLPQDVLDTTTVDPISRAAFWDFCSSVINLVHATTDHQVTIGSASLKWYRVWTPAYSAQYGLPNLNFDFYQSHYYSWMTYCWTDHPDIGTVCQNPANQPVSALALGGKAMVIGEMKADTNVASLFNTLLNNGYAGAWPWGYTQGSSGFSIDWPAYTSWANDHQSIIHWT